MWVFLFFIVLLDLIEQRLEMAKKLGADHCITSTTSETPEQLAARIESTVGHKADQTTECTGAAPCISAAIYVRIMDSVFHP